MAFLKLGDLIDRGHPVTVGDDGTVFTRLNMDQLADSTHHVVPSQETCPDKRSESSFTSGTLTNEVELPVIDFENLASVYQKDECQQGFHCEDSLMGNVGNTITSRETSLQVIESERQTESEQFQYPSQELFTMNLQDVVELEDNVFFPEQPLKCTNITNYNDCGKENVSDTLPYSESTGEPYPEDSRVLFDIGNLGVGHVPAHPGFIKLTTPNDAIPETHNKCEEETSQATSAQERNFGNPVSTSSKDSLVSCKKLIDPQLIIITKIDEEESYDSGSEANALPENDRDDQPTERKSRPRPHLQKCPNPDCNETFPSLRSAKRHCSLDHGDTKPFECAFPDCGIAFRFASYLSRHVQAKHDGVRNHKCQDCDRQFVTARDLAVHNRTHTGERPVHCRQADCERTFSTRSIADKHYLGTHAKTKPFHCNVCERSFCSLSNLIDHKLVHSGVRKFVCPVNGCGKAFLTKGKLKRHDLSHSNLRPYSCEECDCRYRQSSALKMHISKKHAR